MTPRVIHLHCAHVHGAATRSAVAAASRYIAGGQVDSDWRDRTSVEAALDYIQAKGHHKVGSSRVAATAFFCSSSMTREEVWRELDRSFRTKTGEYSRRGGNKCKRGDEVKTSGSPRLAIFMDVSFPPELSEEQKLEIGRDFARAHVRKYKCAVDAAWHLKDGAIDHLHLLITSRKVGRDGVGPIIREFNGISSKCDEAGLRDGKKRLAGHAEWARQFFASRLTEATGTLFDARSFSRQGREESPVPWVTRRRLETERASGGNGSMSERKRMLAERAARASAAQARQDRVVDPDKTIVPPDHQESIKPKPDRAIALRQPAYRTTSPYSSTSPFMRAASADGPNLAGARDEVEVAKRILEQVDQKCREDRAASVREDRERNPKLQLMLAKVHTPQMEDWHLGGSKPIEKKFVAKKQESQILTAAMSVNDVHRSHPKSLISFKDDEDEKKEGQRAREQKAIQSPSLMDQEVRQPPKNDRRSVEDIIISFDEGGAETLVSTSVTGPPSLSQLPGSVKPAPQKLTQTLHRSNDEDSGVRRERRVRTEEFVPPKPAAIVPPPPPSSSASSFPVAKMQGRTGKATVTGATGAVRDDHAHRTPTAGRRTADQDRDEAQRAFSPPISLSQPPRSMSDAAKLTRPNEAVPQRTMVVAPPVQPWSADALDRATVQAFAQDARGVAHRKGKLLTDEKLLSSVALRLHAAGYTSAEAERMLQACPISDFGISDRPKSTKAVATAFSADTAEFLKGRRRFVCRARGIAAQTERVLYRDLRREAMEQFQRDLDRVWVVRRMKADEAWQRHQRRLDFLFAIRWRLRRARRDGMLAMTILSLVIEKTVLQELIKRQKTLAAAELQAINAAARTNSAEIQSRRQQWHGQLATMRTADAARTDNQRKYNAIHREKSGAKTKEELGR